jgi:hypothetical protein
VTPQAPTFLAAASPGAAYLIVPNAPTAEIRVQLVSMAQGARVRFAICVPIGASVRVQYGTSANFVPNTGIGMQEATQVTDRAVAWARNDAFSLEGGVLAFSVTQTAATVARPGRPGCPTGGCNRAHILLRGWAPMDGCVVGADTPEDTLWVAASLVPASGLPLTSSPPPVLVTQRPPPPQVTLQQSPPVNVPPVIIQTPPPSQVIPQQSPPPQSSEPRMCTDDTRSRYVGCYRDLTTPVRMLPTWLGFSRNVRECVDRALQARLRFAGMQWNAECWAGNGPLPVSASPVDNCMFECTGRGGVGSRVPCVDCGTGGFNAVYQVAA